MKSSRTLMALLAPGLLLVACKGEGNKTTSSSGSAPAVSMPASSGDVDPNMTVATVNGAEIKMSELAGNKEYSQQMAKFMTDQAQRKFQMQRSAINSLIDERLMESEAKAAGKSTEEWLKEQTAAKVQQPTDDDLNQLYTRGRRRFKGSFEEEKENVRQVWNDQQQARVKQQVLKELRDKNQVALSLPFPELPRMDISADDDPFKGSDSAAVTIVEFSEFQCPYCSRAAGTIKEIEEIYGDKVKIVFRDFPLEFHANAAKAAEAGECAAEQGKFWEMHDKLFANQRTLEVDNLKTYASEVGLDTTKFNECLDSGQMAEEVKKDMEAGKAVGVTGTPAFFINGQMISGALPLETFRSILDAELQRKGVTPPPATAKPAAAAAGAPAAADPHAH